MHAHEPSFPDQRPQSLVWKRDQYTSKIASAADSTIDSVYLQNGIGNIEIKHPRFARNVAVICKSLFFRVISIEWQLVALKNGVNPNIQVLPVP